MNIAVMVRAYLPVPRPIDMIYAPIDLAVDIASGLAKRGHNVDFYAPLGSKVPGVEIETLNMRPLATNQAEFRSLVEDSERMAHNMLGLWDQYMVNEMYNQAGRGVYDLLHFHHAETALAPAQMNQKIATVYTMHDPIYQWYKEIFELYQTPNQHFISISNNQRRDAPDLPYASTVYNGIDVKKFPFFEKSEDYLMYAGRIVPEKGIKEAIKIAKKTGHRLLIIGPVTPPYQGYFDQHIKPHLNDQILYLGFIERSQLVLYYQKAKAFLMPIQWEEPFGLTMIEAMACGTPVIALRRGSVPEVVKDGKTGFIVDSIAEMVEAVGKIGTINRRACRDHVKEHFSVEKMVDGYEEAFHKMLRSHRRYRRRLVAQQLRRVPKTFKEATQKSRSSGKNQ